MVKASDNSLAEYYEYDAWGNTLASSETASSRYRFTAREWDEESGLSYYRPRYLKNKIGRFLSRNLLYSKKEYV